MIPINATYRCKCPRCGAKPKQRCKRPELRSGEVVMVELGSAHIERVKEVSRILDEYAKEYP